MEPCINKKCGDYFEEYLLNCMSSMKSEGCDKYIPLTAQKEPVADAPCDEGGDTLNGSEAVYGLLDWLTCRDKEVTFSAKHNASIAAELAKQFCEENNLGEPRDDYHTRLIHPKGEIAIAGRGKNKAV